MTIKEYLRKMKGGGTGPPSVGMKEVLWSWVGSAVGVALCGFLSQRYFEPRNLLLILGSLGASAVLIYGVVKSPMAQPRNVIGGHILSALIGVVCYKLCGDSAWFAGALAVSLALAAMLVTRTLHPPGGATALIAVIGGKNIQDLGFLYLLFPVGLGALILVVVGLVVNNLMGARRYPEYWF